MVLYEILKKRYRLGGRVKIRRRKHAYTLRRCARTCEYIVRRRRPLYAILYVCIIIIMQSSSSESNSRLVPGGCVRWSSEHRNASINRPTLALAAPAARGEQGEGVRHVRRGIRVASTADADARARAGRPATKTHT